MGFPGAGMVFSRRLLDVVDWQPWAPGLERLLDTSAMNRCRPHAKTIAWIPDLRETDVRAVDIKTADNLWDYGEILLRQGKPYPEARPTAWMTRHFRWAQSQLATLTQTA